MDDFIYIYKKRIDLKNNNRLIIQTGSCAEYMKDVKAVSYVNGEEKAVTVVENPYTSLLFVYKNAEPEFDREYHLCIDLPEKVDNVKLVLDKRSYPAGHKELELSGKQIEYLRRHMELNLVGVRFEQDDKAASEADNRKRKIKVTGWTECKDKPVFTAYSGGRKLHSSVEFFCREDIVARYPEGEICTQCGFELTIDEIDIKKLKLTAECDGRQGMVCIGIEPEENGEKKQKQQKLAMNNRTSYFTRAISYIAVYGMKRFVGKVYGKLTRQAQKGSHNYYMAVKPDDDRLREQKEYRFDSRPLFSIIIPVFRPQTKYFTRMLESIAAQTYDNWQICLADGSGEGHTMEEAVKPFVDRYGNGKVKYIRLSDNLKIAGN
ncbi:MAG: glycosyltransferase, partial [Lachnospiraceae bacterium]